MRSTPHRPHSPNTATVNSNILNNMVWVGGGASSGVGAGVLGAAPMLNTTSNARFNKGSPLGLSTAIDLPDPNEARKRKVSGRRHSVTYIDVEKDVQDDVAEKVTFRRSESFIKNKMIEMQEVPSKNNSPRKLQETNESSIIANKEEKNEHVIIAEALNERMKSLDKGAASMNTPRASGAGAPPREPYDTTILSISPITTHTKSDESRMNESPDTNTIRSLDKKSDNRDNSADSHQKHAEPPLEVRVSLTKDALPISDAITSPSMSKLIERNVTDIFPLRSSDEPFIFKVYVT